jgi:hypothetical protein
MRVQNSETEKRKKNKKQKNKGNHQQAAAHRTGPARQSNRSLASVPF